MFGILLLLFTLIPAIEIFLLIEIGGVIGGLNTLFVVLATGIIGAALAKSQGLAILSKIQDELNRGQIPTSTFIHGLLVFGGGLLLLTPGFLTDALGLSMVFPGTRHAIAGMLKGAFAKSLASGRTNFHFYGRTNSGTYEYHSHSAETSPQGPTQVGPNTFEAEFIEKDQK